MAVQETRRRRVYRDATISRETRDWLDAASDALYVLAAIEEDVAAYKHGRIPAAILAARVVAHCRTPAPHVTREAADEVVTVVHRWDANDATEVTAP